MPVADVSVERRGHVGLVGLHRPPENYFDLALVAAVADALESLDQDGETRAAVLWSEGKHFCAGASIGGGGDPTRDPRPLYAAGIRLFRTALPVVAAVQGAAVGGGLGLALAADFRVASPETRFDCNFARLGYHHGFGVTVTLPAVVGRQRALELLLAGGRVRGEEARAWGLCDRVVPRGELLDAAVAFAHELGSQGPLAVRAIRATMRRGIADDVWAAMVVESEAQAALAATADFEEGVRAMAERRAPVWTGR
ncbi:MAG: enoyl-CoA hydratase/isomerase family protein [Acidimicrobiales bacterium]